MEQPEVWVLRMSYLAYERFLGVFSSKEAAKQAAGFDGWGPIKRKLPAYMWDDADPFESDLARSECTRVGGSLYIVEPRPLK